MHLIKKISASSIIATISISCFFLSSTAVASSESIAVTNRSTQIISVQSGSKAFNVEPSTKITERFIKQLHVQTKSWHSFSPTEIEGSTITISSTNNIPICTVITHFSIAHQIQTESDNPEKCSAIVDYERYPAEIMTDIVVS